MLRPSYSELMDVLNNANATDAEITSRYTIVIAAAKRAREIINGAPPLTYAPTDKAVSIAVNELYAGKLLITTSKEIETKKVANIHGTYESYLDDRID